VLLLASAALVAATIPTGSWLLVSCAAVGAVVLGLAATRITHAELAQSRRDNNRDRAEQAQAYRRLAEERSAEHHARVEDLQGRIAEREQALSDLEGVLSSTQKQVVEGARALSAQTRRADALADEVRSSGLSLEQAEERAADAIVRLAELEQEVDVLRAELETVTAAWHDAEAHRKRA
jgi:chromosome segregation ATPase